MGGMLIGVAVSLVALAAFSVVVYGAPLAGALGAIAGSLVMIVVLLAHLWAHERREASRGAR
jgi:hypothetical protein